MASVLPVLLAGWWCVFAVADRPDGYIFEVKPTCNSVDPAGAEIDILTDLRVQAYAECDGATQPFVTTDHVHYKLTVGYPALGSHQCVFKKQNGDGVDIYVVMVVVTFEDMDGEMHQDNELFNITCTFDSVNVDIAGKNEEIPGNNAGMMENNAEITGVNSDIPGSEEIGGYGAGITNTEEITRNIGDEPPGYVEEFDGNIAGKVELIQNAEITGNTVDPNGNTENNIDIKELAGYTGEFGNNAETVNAETSGNYAEISEVTGNTAEITGNNEFAGKTLYFSGDTEFTEYTEEFAYYTEFAGNKVEIDGINAETVYAETGNNAEMTGYNAEISEDPEKVTGTTEEFAQYIEFPGNKVEVTGYTAEMAGNNEQTDLAGNSGFVGDNAKIEDKVTGEVTENIEMSGSNEEFPGTSDEFSVNPAFSGDTGEFAGDNGEMVRNTEFAGNTVIDGNNDESSGTLDVEGFIGPVEMETHTEAPDLGTTITLQVLDSLEGDMSDQRVAVGRRIKLKAVASGSAPNERGLQALSCDAVGSGERYPIIQAGCGDGIVFGKTDGFFTEGLVSTSPYFDAFRFQDRDVVHFECNFAFCSDACNGNSCTMSARKRRSGESTDGRVFMTAQTQIEVERPAPPSPPPATEDKAFVKKSKQDEPTPPILSNPYFVVPIAALGVVAFVSFVIAACACARRASSQMYVVNKERKMADYGTPAIIPPRRGKQTPLKSNPVRDNLDKNLVTPNLCDGDCAKPCDAIPGRRCSPHCTNQCNVGNPLYSSLCDGACVTPCNTESGGQCDVTCTNVCSKHPVDSKLCDADCLKPCNTESGDWCDQNCSNTCNK